MVKIKKCHTNKRGGRQVAEHKSKVRLLITFLNRAKKIPKIEDQKQYFAF
jgi:hypothetical protein